jgi:hypothetical protein
MRVINHKRIFSGAVIESVRSPIENTTRERNEASLQDRMDRGGATIGFSRKSSLGQGMSRDSLSSFRFFQDGSIPGSQKVCN